MNARSAIPGAVGSSSLRMQDLEHNVPHGHWLPRASNGTQPIKGNIGQ